MKLKKHSIMQSIKSFTAIVFVISLFSTTVFAQVDRSKPPKGGPAPEINLKKPATFTLDNGLEVIVSENHKLPRVSFQLSVEVDPVEEGDAEGYVAATGSLLRNGTKNRSKAEIDEAVDYIGASLYTYTNGIYASTLSKHQNKLLDVLADILKNPTFPKKELKKYKQKQISSLNAQKTDPSAIARRVAKKLRYKDHPYGNIKKVETIKNITRDKVKDYYKTYYKPNTSYLVIVGDITPEEARKKAEKYFGDWEKGEVPSHEYNFPEENESRQVALVNKDDAEQSVISITYPVDLTVGDEDAIPARVMNNVLGGGVFSGYLMQNLREDKGYTYGARSHLNKDELVGYFKAGADVNTQITDSAITEFLEEMNRLRDEKVDKEHLKLVKQVISGKFARNLEKPRTFADFALNIKKYDLPKDYYSNYLKKVEQVTQEDVQKAARKYIQPDKATILVVGQKDSIEKRLLKFDSDDKTDLYNAFGEPIKTSEAEAGMTAEKVIERYIEARGGRKNLNKIDEIVQTGSASVQGRQITTKIFKKAPNLFTSKTLMNNQVIQKQVFDGNEGKVVNMQGQEQKLSGKQLKNLKYEATMHKFLKYDELGIETELKGIEEVNGEKAYKVLVTYPNGKKRTDYYSKDTGLKIKVKTQQQSRRGKITVVRELSDYREKNGVMFPYKIDISGAQNLTLKVDSIKVNSGIEQKVFQ